MASPSYGRHSTAGGQYQYAPSNPGGASWGKDLATAGQYAAGASDIFSGIMAYGTAKQQAEVVKLNFQIRRNSVYDDLLMALAVQQSRAAASGFMLGDSSALAQLSERGRALSDIEDLRLAARLEAAQARSAGTGALLTGLISGGAKLAAAAAGGGA